MFPFAPFVDRPAHPFPKELVVDDEPGCCCCFCCCERTDGNDEEPAVDTVSLADETEPAVETGAAGAEGIAGDTRVAFAVSCCCRLGPLLDELPLPLPILLLLLLLAGS